MPASPGYLVKVDWTDNSGPRTAVIGVDVGLYPDAVGALSAVKAIVQSFAAAKAVAKNGNPVNFAASVAATIAAQATPQ